MTNACSQMKETIGHYVLGLLGPEEADALNEHMRGCPACREYAQALAEQRRSLVRFGQLLDRRMAVREESVLAALGSFVPAKGRQPPSVWRLITKSRITRLAAAAVIITGLGFLVIRSSPRAQPRPDSVSQAAESPGEMLTLLSLNSAYRKGGMAAVERQYETAFRMLGPRRTRISVQELFVESNGNWKGRNNGND